METFTLVKLEIILDGSETVYQLGQDISGSVIIKLNGEITLSLVSIRLKSVSEVCLHHYTVSIDGYVGPGVVYNESQQYLDIEYELPDNVRNSIIKTGEHCIPFTFKLPDEGIPTSFEGIHGFIKYWIEVNITNPSPSSGKTVVNQEKKYFNVESPILHNIQLSVGGGVEKTVGFLFLKSGKVRIDANIKKKGHIRGEKLELRCRVTNQSTVNVIPRISLSQILIYMAKTRHLALEERSEQVIGKQVNAGLTEEQTLSIDIPSDVCLSIKSRLIQIKYYIHVTLDIPRERDLHLNLPIIVTNNSAFDYFPSFM